MTPGYQSRYAWNEARKVAYLADIFAGKNAGEIVFQEIPSSDPQPKYQLIKGEQEAITLREYYENRLLYKKHATTIFVQMIFSGSDIPCCE